MLGTAEFKAVRPTGNHTAITFPRILLWREIEMLRAALKWAKGAKNLRAQKSKGQIKNGHMEC